MILSVSKLVLSDPPREPVPAANGAQLLPINLGA